MKSNLFLVLLFSVFAFSNLLVNHSIKCTITHQGCGSHRMRCNSLQLSSSPLNASAAFHHFVTKAKLRAGGGNVFAFDFNSLLVEFDEVCSFQWALRWLDWNVLLTNMLLITHLILMIIFITFYKCTRNCQYSCIIQTTGWVASAGFEPMSPCSQSECVTIGNLYKYAS